MYILLHICQSQPAATVSFESANSWHVYGPSFPGSIIQGISSGVDALTFMGTLGETVVAAMGNLRGEMALLLLIDGCKSGEHQLIR